MGVSVSKAIEELMKAMNKENVDSTRRLPRTSLFLQQHFFLAPILIFSSPEGISFSFPGETMSSMEKVGIFLVVA